METVPTICAACTRFTDNLRCTSFPTGIPDDILEGADHRTSRDGEAPFRLDPARQDDFDAWLAFHEADVP